VLAEVSTGIDRSAAEKRSSALLLWMEQKYEMREGRDLFKKRNANRFRQKVQD
jgi:hypothetical protein